MSDEQIRTAVRRLQQARLSLMKHQPFYAVLLLHMTFSLDPEAATAYTDGRCIAFSPEFMEHLSDSELEFVLMHEVLHAALDHCGRSLDTYDFDRFNIACDIVVNSNILASAGGDLNAITLKDYGVSMHLAPDGKEGSHYTVEQVYEMLPPDVPREDQPGSGEGGDGNGNGDGNGKGEGNADADVEGEGSGRDKGNGKGEGNAGGDGGGEGSGKGNGKGKGPGSGGSFDDHTFWQGDVGETARIIEQQEWLVRMMEAAEISEVIQTDGSNGRGTVPLCAERLLHELKQPQTDWRTVLDNFIQEEITDYSFNPPDKRFSDSPFLLPDYNEKEVIPKDLLFMIDTSGSMSGEMITAAFSEIVGAIEQFNGKLTGWLGFFDAVAVPAQPFCDIEELKIIRPKGGGGTSFECIFDYIRKKFEKKPAAIIILTDGYAPFPPEEAAGDIPVLWLLNNEDITPPWGRITRITVEE